MTGVGLKTYIAKRIMYMIIVLFLVISFNFALFNLMPGNPMSRYISSVRPGMTKERWNALAEYYGLNKPLHVRYIEYAKNMLTWDFGISYNSAKPIVEEVKARLPLTLLLIGSSTLISIILGILLGIFAAVKRGSATDSVLVTGALSTYSVPIFWLGWLILFYFAVQLRWFPTGGAWPMEWAGHWPTNPLDLVLGYSKHLFLPVITLVLFTAGGWILLTRACILECLTEDYVTTARAKGLKERTVLLKHILKNASLPLVTSVAMSFAFIISGAIITETVFNYQGMGRWIFQAIQSKDLPVMNAIFYVIALLVLAANFAADLIYGVLDPRIKYG